VLLWLWVESGGWIRQLLRRHHLRPEGPLTTNEDRRLRNILAALRDYGFILAASFELAQPGYKSFADATIRLHNP
jgi:hypothetical protein